MNPITRSRPIAVILVAATLALSSAACASTTPEPNTASGERADSRAEWRDRAARIEPRASFR